MNHQLFDILTRDIAGLGRRRDILRGLVSLGLGVGVARLAAITAGQESTQV